MSNLTVDEMEKLEELAENMEASLYPDYSGRGMYGSKCVGIVTQEAADMLLLGVELAEALGLDRAREMAQNASWDSMGRGQIIYFRRFEAPDAWLTERCDSDQPEV